METGSQSIRSGDILSAYVYLYRGSNSEVGYIQGVNGVMQVILDGFVDDISVTLAEDVSQRLFRFSKQLGHRGLQVPFRKA